MTLRRQFDLLPEDERCLNEYGLPWETIVDGSRWVLVRDFPTHEGYSNATATVAVRLETGYPEAPLDMVYVFPALARKDGTAIPATQVTQQLDGKPYQRWSRHRTPKNPWRVGVDNLGTHLILVEDWFAREFEQ